MKPMATIITPAYNCVPFIAKTIVSVLEQDCGMIDYIVLDDCSTDGTGKVIESLRDVGNGFAYTHHDHNVGEQETVNEGLKLVKGKYFMIVNADDPLLPGAISTLVGFMESCPRVLCAYPDWYSINEDGSYKAHITSREYDFNYMVRHHTCLPSVGAIFRSDVIHLVGYRDTSFHWLGDFDYWLRIGLVGEMVRVPFTLATWRHRQGQESSKKSQLRAQEHVRLMQKFFELPYISNGLRSIEQEAKCWSYLVAAAVSKDKLAVINYVAKALGQNIRMLGSFEFYHALAQHAVYILRR